MPHFKDEGHTWRHIRKFWRKDKAILEKFTLVNSLARSYEKKFPIKNIAVISLANRKNSIGFFANFKWNLRNICFTMGKDKLMWECWSGASRENVWTFFSTIIQCVAIATNMLPRSRHKTMCHKNDGEAKDNCTEQPNHQSAAFSTFQTGNPTFQFKI